MDAQFSTIRDWTKLTGVSRSLTYELLADGKLRAVKLGNRTLIRLPEALAYLDSLPEVQVNGCAAWRKSAA